MTNPRVVWTDRLGAYRYLRSRVHSIPVRQRNALSRYVGNEPDLGPQMFLDPAEVRGEMLSIGMQLGAVRPSQFLARILALATEPAPQSRIAAAWALATALRRRPSQPLITLALALAHDAHYEVRAAAGGAIAGYQFERDTPFAALLQSRIVQLLTDSGTAAPRAVLDALFERRGKGNLDSEIENAVQRLRMSSPSIAIRWRAGRLLALHRS
jgi:hypothetical protein